MNYFETYSFIGIIYKWIYNIIIVLLMISIINSHNHAVQQFLCFLVCVCVRVCLCMCVLLDFCYQTFESHKTGINVFSTVKLMKKTFIITIFV